MLKDGEKGVIIQRDKQTFAVAPHIPRILELSGCPKAGRCWWVAAVALVPGCHRN